MSRDLFRVKLLGHDPFFKQMTTDSNKVASEVYKYTIENCFQYVTCTYIFSLFQKLQLNQYFGYILLNKGVSRSRIWRFIFYVN